LNLFVLGQAHLQRRRAGIRSEKARVLLHARYLADRSSAVTFTRSAILRSVGSRLHLLGGEVAYASLYHEKHEHAIRFYVTRCVTRAQKNSRLVIMAEYAA